MTDYVLICLGCMLIMIGILGIISCTDLRGSRWLLPTTCGELISSRNFISSRGNITYIPQPTLEATLSLFIGHAGDEYIVVIGPTGAGKSTVIHEFISKQPFGVVSLSLQRSNLDIYTIMTDKICGCGGSGASSRSHAHAAKEVLMEAIQIGRAKTGQLDWVPTIVIEVDSAPNDDSIRRAVRNVKSLCVDQRLCRGIIVLCDYPMPEFAMTDDPRVLLLWVDDFSISQANQYFDSLGYLKSDDTSACDSNEEDNGNSTCSNWNRMMREHIYDELGTRPIDLIRLVDDTRHNLSLIESYIDHQKDECTRHLKALFASRESPSQQDFQYLARKILNSPSLSIEASELPVETLFPAAGQVAIILEKYRAIMFHSETGSYVFGSKCILNSAVKWLKSIEDSSVNRNLSDIIV